MKLLSIFISAIFPKRADYTRVLRLDADEMSNKFLPTDINGRLALSEFADPDIRACIHEIKYHDNERAAELLSILLSTWLTSRDTPYLIVPIPLSKERRKERGYNQVARIVRLAINAQPNVTFSEYLLVRYRHTTPQTRLDKKNRHNNIKGAFSLFPGSEQYDFSDKHLLLIDDVLTTGATLSEAEKVLKKLKPASMTTVSIAH